MSWRRHGWTLALWLSVCALGLLGIAQASPYVETAQLQASTTVGELLPGGRVGQAFVAEWDGLSAISVYIGTFGRVNTSTLVFRLRSHAHAEEEEIVTQAVDADTLDDNSMYSFEFPAIRDSQGRRYTFLLEAPDAEPGNAITLYGTEQDVYADGAAILEGVNGEGDVQDLLFRATYDLTLLGKLGVFADRMTEAKPSVWGDPLLYAGLLCLYLALLYGLFYWIVGLFQRQ